MWNRHIWSTCTRWAPEDVYPCFPFPERSNGCRPGHSNGLEWWPFPWGSFRGSSSTPEKHGTLEFANSIEAGFELTFRNPVGVITDGCTWLLHNPSHLLTITSALQVLCIRPSSSNSSLIKWISDLRVSQFSSPVPWLYRNALRHWGTRIAATKSSSWTCMLTHSQRPTVGNRSTRRLFYTEEGWTRLDSMIYVNDWLMECLCPAQRVKIWSLKLR